MPLLIPIFFLTAICGVAYGVDQNDKREQELRKREQEQAAFRTYRQQMEASLIAKEQELVELRAFLDESNWRTREALKEVVRLRAVVADMRRAA